MPIARSFPKGARLLIDNPHRLEGVRVIGVDEHVWRHTHRSDKYVTVIIDLTPIRQGTGPARLLDMIEGRSKQTFKTWLATRSEQWRKGVEVVAMDGFAGFKTAANEELPDATAVMDPFHVVRLAGEALDECRRRIQHEIHGRRGRKNDPLYAARRTLHTRQDLLTDRQVARLMVLFTDERHVEVEATWGLYQRMIHAYQHKDRPAGKKEMNTVIDALRTGVPSPLDRARQARPHPDQAPCRHPGLLRTSNGPTEAINGRLEHLRGTALGFRNLANYITRSLLETDGFKPHLHP